MSVLLQIEVKRNLVALLLRGGRQQPGLGDD
jgi:hypothetical protein